MPTIHPQSHIHAGAIGRPLRELLAQATPDPTRVQLTAFVTDDHTAVVKRERYVGPGEDTLAEVTSLQPVNPLGHPVGAPQLILTLPRTDGFPLSYVAENGNPAIVQVQCQGDPRTGEGSFTLRGKGEEPGDVHIATYPHEQQILYSRLRPGTLDTVYDYRDAREKLYTP